jgi:hypothetical protein
MNKKTLFGILTITLALSAQVQAQLTYTTNSDNTLTITGYTGTNTVLVIPTNINGLVVTSIGYNAFSAYDNPLTSITMPDTVTSIGATAFYGCHNAIFTIPSGVTNIGQGAFAYCSSLTTFTIPGGVTTLLTLTFLDCTSLTSVYFTGNAPTADSTVFEGDPTVVYYYPGTSGWSNTFAGVPAVLLAPNGSLQVIITPENLATYGAQWQVDDGSNQNSGATVTNLSVGSHTVSFTPVFGWNTPSNQVVIITNNALTTASGIYTPTSIPCPATATATVVDKFVVAATVTDGGCDYTNAPLVSILGGGGTGAAATAVVSNGIVVGITITDAGSDYTSTPALYIYTPISITVQPQSVVVDAYSNASFSVTAYGTPLNYQWSFNGTNIPTATSSNLTMSNVAQCNLGTYSVLVTNAFSTTNSSNATLSMYPYLAVPFAGLDTYWGYTNILSVDAWGSGPLSYQWYQNGVALPNATNQTLDLTGVQFTNAGLYSVVVTSPFGSITNAPEQVVVNPAGISVALYPGVTIQGVVGYSYLIQSTANLADTNSWVTVTNLTLTQPTELWIDTNTDASLPANAQRFYQVLPGQ